MTTTTDPRLYLSLPKLSGRLYWELEVTNYTIWVSLKKRPWGLWRNAIKPIARTLVDHNKGELTQGVLNKVMRAAQEMVECTTPADRVYDVLLGLTDDSVKVVLDR